MRLFRHLILCALLLLAASSLGGVRIPVEYLRGLRLVPTAEGCHVWLDSKLAEADVTWSGPCSGKRRLADGFGRLELTNNGMGLIARFDGTMSHGHKSRHGREFQPDLTYNALLTRGWADDRFTSGTETIGRVRYKGGFYDDLRDGVGYMFWPNGDVHRGGWRNGLPNGYGETRMGAAVIAGQWRDGCLLDSARTVAVAVPLEACVGLAAGRNPSTPAPDVTMRRVRSVFDAPSSRGGCVPIAPGSYMRWCK